MKKIILTLLIWNFCVSINAQSVTFYSDQISYDDETLLMKGNFGDWTNRQSVELVNRTGQNINIRTHLHHHLNFVYFVNSENTAKHNLEINIPSGGKYTLDVIAKLQTGKPIVYNDQLGFDIIYQDGRDAYFEINASAYFYNSNGGGDSTSFSKPEGYGYTGLNGREIHQGKPYRWNKSDFPLKVYSNHTSNGYSNEYTEIIQKAVSLWNVAGNSVGIGSDVFVLTNSLNNADVTMDWSGQMISEYIRRTGKRNTLGLANAFTRKVGMWPLNIYNNNFHKDLGNVGETLVQELGHLLGPIHSNTENDIMNGTAHGHWHDLSQIELTNRDRRMLGWIYSRSDYYPF
tara:strand:- start:1346 stop:2380 length:1035 start_codon:yes stop_codon:yes gene_type:complete